VHVNDERSKHAQDVCMQLRAIDRWDPGACLEPGYASMSRQHPLYPSHLCATGHKHAQLADNAHLGYSPLSRTPNPPETYTSARGLRNKVPGS
jgi:hypothetical protein